MDIVRFDERAALNGWRVRVKSNRVESWSFIFAYSDLYGMTGTIVPNQRLPWVDKLKRPYKMLAVLFDKDIGCPSNITVIGVHNLELIGWGKCPHQFLSFQGHIAAPGYGQSWVCTDCGEAMWSSGGSVNAVPYADLDRDPELCLEDIV